MATDDTPGEFIPYGPWNEEPDLWDTLNLGDRDWPGFAKVAITRGNKWDDKKAKGVHSMDRNFSGAEAAKVTITLAIWTSAHYAQLVELLPLVEPDPTSTKKEPPALNLTHPQATLRKVSMVTIDKVEGLNDQDRDVRTMTIAATEYHKPLPAPTGKAGATPGGANIPPTNDGECSYLAYAYQQGLARHVAANKALRDSTDIFNLDKELEVEAAQQNLDDITAQMKLLGCGNTTPSQSGSKTDPKPP